MSINCFITGTDTDVGKTYITLGLLKKFNTLGYSTIALKPLATGCQTLNTVLHNADALALQAAASVKLSYEEVNPFSFEPPVSPDIAARQEGMTLTATEIGNKVNCVLTKKADVYLVEGLGGWAVPINHEELMADVVRLLGIPVILVVKIRLGAINQALLTAQAIARSGCSLIAWVANAIDSTLVFPEESIRTLTSWLKVPCLGVVPQHAVPEDFLDLTLLETLFARNTA